MKNILLVAIFAAVCTCSALAQVRLITTMTYTLDNGSPTIVDVTDGATANLNEILSTTGLSDGLHRLHISATDDVGRTGVVTDGFIGVISNDNSGQARVITDISYQIDGGSFTNFDVTDAAEVNWNTIVATGSLANGLHRIRVRGTDDLGRTSVITDGFFATISNDYSGQTRLVTQMEYRIDGGSYVPVDNPDSPIVNFSEIIATGSLGIGLHDFDVRSTDDAGRSGVVSRAFLIVTSPFGVGETRTISAAEFWLNVDPGVGNGVAIPLPDDGAYDESQEDVQTVFTDLPVGLHLVGFRTRDELGRWSKSVTDSIIVGPIVVIHRSGDDIVLDWQSGNGVDIFHVFRSNTTGTGFGEIATTAGYTYTDVGRVTAADLSFYHVTFEATALSNYRLPNMGRPMQ